MDSKNNQVHQSEYLNFDDAKEFWNKRFEKEEFIFGKEPNEYLALQAKTHLKPNQKVLCIADGEGRNGVWLAKQGMQVVGFDVSDIALKKPSSLLKKIKWRLSIHYQILMALTGKKIHTMQ